MKAIRRLWGLLFPPLAEPIGLEELKQSYQLGHHNGFWSGVLHGRKAALDELEADLAARGRGVAELETADVARAKLKVIH